MSRTQQRWALLTVMIFAVVVAACSPTATPTPTTRPTATTVPPTAAATAESVGASTAESTAAATVEATKASVSLDATLAPIVAQSPTPSLAVTEEATEMTAATEEATEMSISAVTEAATEISAATEAATEVTAATEAATEMSAATVEATEATAAPTEAVTAEATVEATTEATATVEATAELGTIIDVAKADGNFTTLLAAIDKADLTKKLEGDGPFTVFAPTDDAFKALLASTNMTAAELLSNPDLAKILEYHVVSGKITADDFAEFKSVDNPDLIVVPTLDGDQKLSITVDTDGTITINGTAKVTLKNVMASNGVIHVIDAVLMPADMATPEATAAATASS